MVFLSYSRKDLETAICLERRLRLVGIEVWRDEQQFDPGELWPKQLGEEIARAGHFVLAWTVNAAESRIVELEWNIALAMGIPILPLLLDDTELPMVLRPVQGLPMKAKPEKCEFSSVAFRKLENKLLGSSEFEGGKTRDIIPILEEITNSLKKSGTGISVEEVLSAVSEHRQVHFHVEQPRRPLFPWTLVSLTFVAVIIFFFKELTDPKENPPEDKYSLEGVLLDSVTRQPLGGYTITIPGDTDRTTSGGGFTLYASHLKVGMEVRIQVFRNDTFLHDQFIVHPGPETIFINPK